SGTAAYAKRLPLVALDADPGIYQPRSRHCSICATPQNGKGKFEFFLPDTAKRFTPAGIKPGASAPTDQLCLAATRIPLQDGRPRSAERNRFDNPPSRTRLRRPDNDPADAGVEKIIKSIYPR